ncbi:hypothetical protein QVD99_003696 [Batrachochytrium dendrobatidis]|uniref:Elongator complex protein 5 n=1 Tax=Batrachochytrium dendrobatidis (strain JEL423) TaxID=403673 RepID=A0A177WCS4_BATDL|nr:hypothetical protein O5D80_004005 [Batrachochytrium dendrobatidis]KAK5669296.1 hypothetical protein QVD99_003696 [Batrachochytrium dendrobatidis]OAJ37833.1 hypothetical protein BDEG_21810 [Batrachochytrium dendrobatidis JEL423]
MPPSTSTTSSFTKLLRGKETSAQTIAIASTLDQPALPWIQQLLNCRDQSKSVLVLVCLQTHPQVTLKYFKSQSENRYSSVHLIDVRSSIVPLTNSHSSTLTQSPLDSQTISFTDSFHHEYIGVGDLVSSVDRIIKSYPANQVNVIFDSLDPLLIQSSVSQVSLLIVQLFNSVKESATASISVPIHMDVHISKLKQVHGPKLNVILMQHADVYISLFDPPVDYEGAQGLAELILKKRSGKVIRETSAYRFSKNSHSKLLELVFLPFNHLKTDPSATLGHIDQTTAIASNAAESAFPEKPDPTSNLSFNLSLTSIQRTQRSQVVLPYLQARGNEHVMQNHPEVSSGGGIIHYQHDDADDYDDEDPDDDLDV